MKTAIVILNWNGRELLEKFLPSVISHSADDATIYVADNASTDDSVIFVRNNFPEVRIIQNQVNGGYAKGYNDALRDLDEELLVLMNSDIETSPDWLKPIQEVFRKEADLGAAQPKILDYKRKTHFEYAGAAGGFIDKLGYPFCRGRIFDTLEEDRGQYDDIYSVFWASGACFVVRKKVFWEAGALDELFFAHQEEIDLCWRIQNQGYTVKSIGTSKVFHVGGATLDTMDPKKTLLNFRNTLYTLVKNVGGYRVIGIIFGRLLLDAVAGLKFLAEGKPGHFTAILKAHLSFYKNLPEILKKRKTNKKSKKYFKTYFIVWQYFVKKHRQFDQLKQ